MKKYLVWVILGLTLLLSCSAWGSPLLEVTATSPWLTLLTNFIGGINVKVNSIQEWNEDGELVRRVRARNLRFLPSESRIMAFDYRDAKGLGVPFEQYKNYRPLYDLLPLDEHRIDASLSDPSVIPFIAQRVLTILADWDPSNYPYYQRRLAEFQARLYSTTLAGRQILKNQPVYDLTGHSGTLLQAAGCKISRPSAEEWSTWSAWKETRQLTEIVSRMAEEKVAVVLDHSTPKAIRSLLSSNPTVYVIARPRFDQDYPAFLHDQYISLWSKITSKPLPTPIRRR
ncbi:MAG: hypothetical protein LBJ36_04120 [Synergistaceae bacterium]|nr:hypothetical protein [Synergistaceae bacterium]